MGSAMKAFWGAAAQRFRADVERLAASLSDADGHEPLRGYLTGLMLPGARKRVEPMAALLAPKRGRQTHQSLHHLVADAPLGGWRRPQDDPGVCPGGDHAARSD